MKNRNQAGFSLLSMLVAIAILGISAAVAASALRNYVFSYHSLMNQSISRELRSSTISMLYQAVSIYAAKQCATRSNSNFVYLTDSRVADLVANLIKKHGMLKAAKMSLNDLAINGDFGGSVTFGRPAKFDDKDLGVNDPEFSQAIDRCNTYSFTPDETSTSFNGCFELGSRNQAPTIAGVKSLYSAEKGLIEYRLEFVDTMNLAEIQCNALHYMPRTGVVLKTVLYWKYENSIRRVIDVTTFAI